jgi:hypothetical protein
MPSYDAAPLPRLGEVFFDVRGHSRSMRLSWYGDTGVAVLSIWQGDRCSGTFRLPADELSRMVDTLQRGPDRDQPARDQPESPQYESAQFDSPQFDSPQLARDGYGPRDSYGPEDGYGPAEDGYGPREDYGSGSHALSYPPPPSAPELTPPGPVYASSAPEIHPSDPLGLDYRGAETAGYRDGVRPERTGSHRSAEDSRTDLGPAVGDLPDYLAAPGRDYRPADPGGYPADDFRGHPADDRQSYPAADIGGYPAADRRDYAPGAMPESRRDASAPAADDRAAEAYPSWTGTDSGAHSRSGGWPEDYPDDESLPRGRAPSGPRQDRRLAEDRRGRNLVPRPAPRPPQR